jgi:dTDP-L-rhamnose 4-epimerase
MQNGVFECACPACGEAVSHVASLEDDPIKPISVYGITKLAQEQLIRNCCQSAGIPNITFRYQNVYGPGQSLRNPYTGILSIFTQVIRLGGALNIFEDGLASRDFVFVDDVAEYNVRALESNQNGAKIMNIGSGRRQSILDVVQELSRALGREPRFHVSGQFRIGDIRHASADITGLTLALGEVELVPFAAGVQALVDWAVTLPPDGALASRYAESLEIGRKQGVFIGRDNRADRKFP